MPIFTVDGEGAARYIKTTNNKNANTPIIAVSAYSGTSTEPTDRSDVFAGSLQKPVQKADLLSVMRQLGFKTSTVPGRRPARASVGTVSGVPPAAAMTTTVVAAR